MNCREAESQIFAARDGALAPAERAGLAAHLATCEACRRVSQQLEAVASTLRAEAAAVRVPDPDLEWRKLERTINGRSAEARRSWISWIAIPAALAGAAAVAVLVGTGNHGTDSTAIAPRMVARQQVVPTPAAAAPSTVVYVDDKSGWTFVWSPDSSGRNI